MNRAQIMMKNITTTVANSAPKIRCSSREAIDAWMNRASHGRLRVGAAHEQIGLAPKTVARIARMHHAIRLMTKPDPPRWSDIAATCGYADQPHLNRHFARIVGVPPGAYQRERKNVQDRPDLPLVASGGWQSEHHPQTYPGTPKQPLRPRAPRSAPAPVPVRPVPTPLSSATPSVSESP